MWEGRSLKVFRVLNILRLGINVSPINRLVHFIVRGSQPGRKLSLFKFYIVFKVKEDILQAKKEFKAWHRGVHVGNEYGTHHLRVHSSFILLFTVKVFVDCMSFMVIWVVVQLHGWKHCLL